MPRPSLVVVVVAVLQIFTLDVPSHVVGPGQLDPILVHAPADAPLPAQGGFTLQGVRGVKREETEA